MSFKKLLLVLIVLFTTPQLFAQQSGVSGTVMDTISKEYLQNASIALIRSKDSVLYKYTRSDKNGRFIIQDIDSGRYFILIAYPNYADYSENFTAGENKETNLGIIKLTLTANLLQEVIIQQKIAAVRMKGDTTEFTADSFKVRQGASVEEMLKKLPGITVDKDGKITAMGEKVQKILVDGDEFFGDDPTVATKNLQASDIDKVQVFDKKSDKATFTGIDDGEKTKTINLKMKSDRKNGFFGKVDLAAGPEDKWANSVMFNRFKGNYKFSVYGINSSTGKIGLNWEDSRQFGGNENIEYMDDGAVYYTSDEFSGSNFYGEGLPKSWTAGINYSDKFNDKHKINGSYRFNKINVESASNTVSQIITGEKLFNSNEYATGFNQKNRHSLNATYEWNLDSSTIIKLKAKGTADDNYTDQNFSATTFNKQNIISNQSTRNNYGTEKNNNSNINFSLFKKFKKTGRSISFYLNHQYYQTKSNGYLIAQTDTLADDGNLYGYSTDQLKKVNSDRIAIGGKIAYTEPLWKNVFAEINYGLTGSKSNSERLTYDADINRKYNLLNDTFSNRYSFDVTSHNVGAILKYSNKKLMISGGSDVYFTTFYQTDKILNQEQKRSFNNFFPKAQFNYKFSSNESISLSYNGSTKQPTIQQLQPMADNNNPLIIAIGNPDLKQVFTHRFNASYNNYQTLKQRGYYAFGNISFNQNDIVNSSYINDTSAKTIYQYINMNGNYNFYGSVYYWMKLQKLNMFLNVGPGISGSNYNSMVNNKKSLTQNVSPNIYLSLSKEKEKAYNISVSNEFAYNFSTATVQNQKVKNNYYTITPELDITVQLPWKFELNSTFELIIRETTPLFKENNRRLLWNGYIGKKLFKNDKGMIKLSGYDILDQNVGYTRSVSSFRIIEKDYLTLRRYFFINFTWNFNNKTASPTQTVE